MTGDASRDAQIWHALRAARPRPTATDPIAAVGSLAAAQDVFVARLREASAAHEVRTHVPVRHARHLASVWGMGLGEAVRATLFDADGAPILVAVPADRKIDALKLRTALGVEGLAVLRADRGVGRLGWVNLPGDPGPLPALPNPFRARLIADPEIFAPRRIVLSLNPTVSVRLGPRDYLAACGGATVECVGRTRLLPEGGVRNDPPARAD